MAVRIESQGSVHWVHVESRAAAELLANAFPGSSIWQGLLQVR